MTYPYRESSDPKDAEILKLKLELKKAEEARDQFRKERAKLKEDNVDLKREATATRKSERRENDAAIRWFVFSFALIVFVTVSIATISTLYQGAYHSAAIACQPGYVASDAEVYRSINRRFYWRVWDRRVICVDDNVTKVVTR